MKKRILLSACLMTGMVLGVPANAEVEYIPDPTKIVTNGVFTLGTPQTEQPTTGGYILLNAIDKSSNPYTISPMYSTFTLNKTEYIYGDGPYVTLPQVTVDIPNSTAELTVKYTTSQARLSNLTSDISGKVFANISSTSDGAAIYNTSTANYKITDSVFLANKISSSGWVPGGAIWSNGKISEIDNSVFISNSATDDGGAILNRGTINKVNNSTFIYNRGPGWGSAISNFGTINTISNSSFISNYGTPEGAVFIRTYAKIGTILNSVFISNKATQYGGAISLQGASGEYAEVTNGIINSVFISNSANIYGGAIYVSDKLSIISDNGLSLFQNNTDSTGLNAIYIGRALGILTFDIKNGGSTYMYDTINGVNGYNVVIKNTGDADSTGTFYMYNDIKNANVTTQTTGNKINIDTADGQTFDYNFKTLTSDDTALYKIDIDLANGKADCFNTSANSTGTVYINDINLLGLTGEEQEGYTKTAQVLNTPSNTLKLGLNNDLASNVTLLDKTYEKFINVEKDVYTNSEYGGYDHRIVLKGGFSLAESNTTNDSLKMAITDKTVTDTWTSKVDTLKAWSEQTTTEDRTFSFVPAQNTYTVTKDLEKVSAGNLLINGISGDTITSKLDADNKKLFTIDNSNTNLTINNIEIKNAKTDTAAIDNQSGVVNLNNVTFTSNTTDVNNDNELNITGGTVTINNGITGTNGDTTVDGGNLVISYSSNGLTQKSLTIESGSVSANAEKITTNGNAITNKGTLNFTGGTNSNAVTGTGTTQISGTVNNTANISQDTVEITSTGNLSSDASKLTLTSNTVKNDGTFNINDSEITLNVSKNTAGNGTVNLNNANTNINSTISDNNVVFNGSVLTFSDPANNIASSNLTMNNGGLINIQNGTSGKELAMQNLTLKADTTINMDSDIVAGTMDSLKLASFTNTSGSTLKINPHLPTNVSEILTNSKIQMLPISKNSTLSASDKSALASSIDMVMPDKIVSPIFTYKPSYSKETGIMTLAGGSDGGGYNPSVLASPVAAQVGAMASQWNSYNQAFINMDMNMLYTREQRKAMKYANRYAMLPSIYKGRGGDGLVNPPVSSLEKGGQSSALQASNRLAYDTQTPIVYSNTYTPERDLAGWARPYASFEKVDLRNGPNVHNTMYGMYMGGDSEMFELKHNWDFQYSVYAGYNGSRQSYNDVTILQNGGTLGATGIFYHDNFFTALTANVGASVANADTMYGHEDFPMLMTGVASKTGYNLEMFKGKFIIQPSWLMSYSFVNTFNYKNAAGVRVESDGLHAIQLAPQLKFIGNLPHGWQPYASIQMVWNIMDETKFRANNVSLPYMSIKPYIQYGVGVQKRWGERFTGFFQTMIRNGGRTGVAFTLGFRWALGSLRDNNTMGNRQNSTKTVIKESTPQGIRTVIK